MGQVEVFLVFTERLERAAINHMATGFVASMLYGIPRFTHDLEGMLEVSGDIIDQTVIQDWIEKLGLQAQWREVKRGPPTQHH